MNALTVAVSGAALADDEQKGPPFADGPDAPKIPPRPKTRTWTVVKDAFTFTFQFDPGIGVRNEVLEVSVTSLETPTRPDPKWGSTVPLIGARMVAEHLSPAGEVLARYRMHEIPLVNGKYALHLTPSEEGLHGLRLRGRLADGREISAALKLPVDVWPLPKELEGKGDSGGAVRRRVVRKPLTGQ
ncbi:MAG: hypothetical protein AAFZ18_26220 [Myxococcota bacterium]